MTIETKVAEFKPQLRKLEKALIEKSTANRRQVADIAIFSFGYAVHIGGHHVAIHDCDRNGNIAGERLALVTSDGPDWK